MSKDNDEKDDQKDRKKTRLGFGHRSDAKKAKTNKSDSKKIDQNIDLSPVVFGKLPEGAQVLDTYDLFPPYAKITVASLPELGGGSSYFIEEVSLSEDEKRFHSKLLYILSKEIAPPKTSINAKTHVANEARRLAKKYGLLKEISEESWPRLTYHICRDLAGFGDIDVMMNDPMIEDISVNGVNLPVYIWHRKYESLPTNLTFTEETALDNLIVKLTHLSGKHISTAFPILDAMLPGKDRLAATFRKEVSPKGGSFSIRRFREEPFSVVELIEMGTLNEEIAAYFWMLIENRMTAVVIGGTGAGKTSTLNALASLVKPQMKIVTVEEIPEINLRHDNWVQLVGRESYGLGAFKSGEVNLFELVKTSLRYRPDYIVVGEIRGEEAFVLFQALATGHGGLTTIHAENLEYAVKRLTSHPMNVAKPYVSLLNVAPLIGRVKLPASKTGGVAFGRRIKSLVEIVDFENYRIISEWNPADDTFKVDLLNSIHLSKIAERNGLPIENVLEETNNRANFLRDMKSKGIKKNVDLSKQITAYYAELDHFGLRRR